MYEFKSEKDWFFTEVRWWLENRGPISPILVASTEHGPRYIPDLILERWPAASMIRVDPRSWSENPPAELETIIEINIESILAAIDYSAGGEHTGMTSRASYMTNIPGLFTWEIDRAFRYINANENYARAAGYDSPRAMIGKSDDEMPWRSLADFFRSGDDQVMSGKVSLRDCVLEKEVMLDRVADILVTEGPLVVRGKCIGLTGCFLDITGRRLVPVPSKPAGKDSPVPLGRRFGNESFSTLEVQVFRGLVRCLSAQQIADTLSLSRKIIESQVRSIRRKLQCRTDGEVIAVAVEAGLPLALFGPVVGL
jgi:DNA-binding CsgD family transcriptional regulator/PAS domain-containing protein